MCYLEQKQFIPAMILLGIPFIPCIISLIIANIILFKVELLIVLLIILMIYLTIVFILWKLSRRKNHYLLLKEDEVEIVFHDFSNGKEKLNLSVNQIIKIEYYRITSIKGWLMLFSYIFPKCLYITYKINEVENTKFIGYMDLKDIKKIATDKKIKLIIK